MILWLKFDSSRLQIDAASNYVLLLQGKPKPLFPDKVFSYLFINVFLKNREKNE